MIFAFARDDDLRELPPQSGWSLWPPLFLIAGSLGVIAGAMLAAFGG